jgi:hypothetical protein
MDDGRARLALAPPARHGDRWSVVLEHGALRIAVADAGPRRSSPVDSSAGVERRGRTTAVYLAVGGARLRAALEPGDRALLLSDGQRVRLHLPRERAAALDRMLTE